MNYLLAINHERRDTYDYKFVSLKKLMQLLPIVLQIHNLQFLDQSSRKI